MEAPSDKIKIWSSYNLSAISFSPEEIFGKIREQYPEFKITYKSDFRQAIADSWPQSIDDTEARKDWGWGHKFDLDKLVEIMLVNLEQKLATT
jgi:hypothetical protein